MAQVTKLELSQRLEASLKEVVALRQRISVLEAECARKERELAALAEQQRSQAPKAQRVVRRTPWQRPAHMEAAREAAMRMGKVVRVEAAHQ